MRRPTRWSSVIAVAWSFACISVPLPDRGPELETVAVPAPGDDPGSVRQVFGEPQRLDLTSAWVYEWTTDRRFIVVPVMPTGLPVGAAVAGNRYRMLVDFGPDGRVRRVACTERQAAQENQPRLGCEQPVDPLRGRARKLFAYSINSRPDFEKTSFFNWEGGTGAPTPAVLSADGRLLAITDSKNRLWVLDTETGGVVHRHDGEPIRFLSLAPAGQVKGAFADNGRTLVVAQRKVGVEILDRSADGSFTAAVSMPDGDIGQLSVAGDDRTVFAFGEAGISILNPDGARSTPIDPMARLDFSVDGPERVEPLNAAADLVAVHFGQSWWTGGRSAVFAGGCCGHAVLDLRNDFARLGRQGYGFSSDGRWLAHNTGRHLELWQSADLFGIVEGRLRADEVTPAWVALMPFTNRTDEDSTAHLPVAFRADGGLVAAGSRAAIHVWRSGDGEPVALVGALRSGYDHPTGGTTVVQAEPDNSSAFRVLAIALAPDNRLTAVFCDWDLNVFVGAWQIDE